MSYRFFFNPATGTFNPALWNRIAGKWTLLDAVRREDFSMTHNAAMNFALKS